MSNLRAKVKPQTSKPVLTDPLVPDPRVYTDDYSMDARLRAWGYDHKSGNQDEESSRAMKMATACVKSRGIPGQGSPIRRLVSISCTSP